MSLLFAFFLFLFGIIGVNLFAGKLHHRCTEPGALEWVDDGAVCNPDKGGSDCEGGQTCEFYEVNPGDGALSYDNCLYAFVTIFQAVSLEGWVDQMYMLEITTDRTTAVVYYILVVIFGAMFIVNLFLAVMFDSFFANLDEEAEEAPEPAPLAKVMDASAKKKGLSFWEYLIYFLIVGNTVTMCLTHDGESETFARIIELSNYFFTIVFTLEMVIKLFSYGPRSYFNSGWNTFDFVVTWSSLVDLVLDYIGHDTDLLRALRVARVMRLLRLNEDMRRFEATAVKIASKLLNLSGVLVLIIIVAAMLGMELFGGKLGSPPPRTNFDYFSNAFITVFVVTSGENWNDVFAGTLPYTGHFIPVLYFVPLFVLGNYVLVNLFIAIICWGWDSAKPEDDEVNKLKSEADRALLEKQRLQLSHSLSQLRSAHTDVLLELQELIAARQLGFSAASGSRLMARMGQLFKDFEAAADTAPADQVVVVGGLALGFASLIKGLGQILDDAATTEASAEMKLLLEYWESEHARTSGAATGGGVVERLSTLLRKYVTTITANRVLMGVVATLRAKEREKREKRGARLKAGAPEAPPSPPGHQVLTFPSDPPGAGFLPLTLDSKHGAFHRQLRAIVTNPMFDNIIIMCILLSSLSLAFDMPDVVPNSPTANTLELCDLFFTFIFLGEFIIKIITFGPCGEEGYFNSSWNILDFSIVTTSVISILAADAKGFGAFKAMRALRTLRPLRVIQRFKGLKQVVNSLFRAIPAVLNVAQICFLILIVYGLFGMQFLMGRLGHCNDDTKLTRDTCVGSFTNEDGATLPRWWGNPDVASFDNIGMAMLTLFEMSTLEMWPDVMFLAMDANPHETGQPLVVNQNSWMAVYIISWIVVSAFFLLNLFVGVVLENFNAIRSAEDGSGLMSDDQKEWSKTLQNVLTVRAEKAIKPPGGKKALARFRRCIFMIVQGDREHRDVPIAFEKFIITLVLLNVLAMAFTWYDQPSYMDEFAEYADVFFTVAFTLEAVLKLTGLGIRQYLLSGWNVFDFTLVSGALIADMLKGLESLGVQIDPGTIRLLRIFRIARLLRLMKVGGKVNQLITTVVVSVPALANVGVLLFLFLYIYSILGVELFHKLPLSGDFINDDANFASFGNAMLTLFRCITGESYNGIMHDAMITDSSASWVFHQSAPGRCSSEEGTCGNPLAAVIFFITFVIIEAMVMLNLIVAVVLDTFADEQSAEEMKLNTSQIEQFQEAWKDVDPEATHFMPTKDLKKLLLLMDPPLGFKDSADRSAAAITEHLKLLEVPDRAGSVAFHDVLEAMGKNAMGKEVELPQGTDGVRSITKQYGEVFKSTGLHKTVVSQYSSAYIFAVIRMQNAFRRRLAKRRNGSAGKAPSKGAGGNAFMDAARKKAGSGAGSSSRATPKGGSKRK